MTVALDVMLDTEMCMSRLMSSTAAGQTATLMILAEVATRGTVTTHIQTCLIATSGFVVTATIEAIPAVASHVLLATVKTPDTTSDVRSADFVARIIAKQEISHIGIGAILLQENAAGEKRLMAFASREVRP